MDSYICGNARFTVITDGVIRMEYARDARFVDEPTLFAVRNNREEADIAIGDLQSHTAHVADNAVNFVVFALEHIEAILHAFAAQSLEFFAEEVLVFGFWHIISKHHEHGGKKGGIGRCFEKAGRVQRILLRGG